jgi:hypothetical protein
MSRFLRETNTGAPAGDENGVTKQLHWRFLQLVLNWLTGLFEADHLGSSERSASSVAASRISSDRGVPATARDRDNAP